MISSVWSTYGHAFLSEDDHERCLICGAEYDLVADDQDPFSGTYQNYRGDQPATRCNDLPDDLVHGYDSQSRSHHSLDHCQEFDDLGECDHTRHGCNCNLCI